MPEGARRHPTGAAAIWLAVVLAIALHQWSFWREAPIEFDVLALLPVDERAPEVGAATELLANAASRRIIVMLGAADEAAARQAASAWRAALPPAAGWRTLAADPEALSQAVAFYRPWRDRLLTAEQRTSLASLTPEAAARDALRLLHQPGVALRVTDWAADPLALWPQWWRERAGETLARARDGEWTLAAEGRHWVVLLYETARPAFEFSGEGVHGVAIVDGRRAAETAVPGLRLVAAGVPLHAEAAAVQASREINTIGWGSLTAVLLLVWLAFRSGRPIVLVAVSLAVGCAAGLSATALVFGEVHLVTLVFGASLVGVAEDYGLHWFASRQGHPDTPRPALMRQLLPGLAVALGTSMAGYGVLGLADFPGLRQMAVFSAVGLAAAFATVWCWFPALDGTLPPAGVFARTVAASLARWPRWRASRQGWTIVLLAGALVGAGLWRLAVNDDLRQLQSSPPELVQQQRELMRLLGAPSPLQFFLVTAGTADEVLQREEALTSRLAQRVSDGTLAGWRALSDWIPSQAAQQAAEALTAHVERAALQGVNAALGESLQRPAFAPQPLAFEAWLAGPAAVLARDLWLGEIGAGTQASVVMLRGLQDPGLLPRLASAATGLPGVRWVDRTAEMSSLLGRYRATMTALLVGGHIVVLLLLAWRYGRDAWRVWLPVAVASLVSLALLGWIGAPLQLFNILALLLLLGVGVDYGVFLLEHRGDGAAWLAVLLGAASTALSFGLLALSDTPALHAFGLTLLVGLVVVTLLAPTFRASASHGVRRVAS
ncbi:MAG: hypothetical protein IPI08_10885 [Betaproteobacteria bacterium]|nr:hypothetical protein [Betaproteobacteria bacterium]